MQQARQAYYRKLAGDSPTLQDLIELCMDLPAVLAADAAHFAPVLASMYGVN